MNKLQKIVFCASIFITLWSRHVFAKNSTLEFKYNLVICAIFRNEAPYLNEWIQFHQLVGVEHFYLYNNCSSDNFKKVLAPYIKQKMVTLINWPYKFKEFGKWGSIQCSAYQHAIDKCRGKTKWLAILDIDEFLFPTKANTLVEFLKDYDEFGGVCANWQMYGTSYVSKIPTNQLLIETLHLKAPVNYKENTLVKSIVQPLKVIHCAGPHTCFFVPGSYHVNENKEKFEGFSTPYISIEKIRVNHYWSRDEEFFNKVKVPRRESWNENIQRQLDRLNFLNSERDDEAIQRFIAPLRKHIFSANIHCIEKSFS